MILDLQNLCSDAQAVTATAVSTNAIDLWGAAAIATVPGPAGTTGVTSSVINDVGRGETIEAFCQVGTANFTGGTSMQAQLITSAAAALTGPTVLSETAVIALAALVAGYQFRFGTIPQGVAQRYLGFNYIVVGTMATGTITAGFVLDRQTNPFVG